MPTQFYTLYCVMSSSHGYMHSLPVGISAGHQAVLPLAVSYISPEGHKMYR